MLGSRTINSAAITCSMAIFFASASLLPNVASSEEPTRKLVRTLLEAVEIPGSGEELRLFQVEIAPGYSVPPHYHPVAGVCYVIDGTAETQYEGEDAKVVRQGDSFHDLANKTHSVFRNKSATDVLKFVCATRIEKGQNYLLTE